MLNEESSFWCLLKTEGKKKKLKRQAFVHNELNVYQQRNIQAQERITASVIPFCALHFQQATSSSSLGGHLSCCTFHMVLAGEVGGTGTDNMAP